MSTEVGSGQVAIFPVFKGFRKVVGMEVDKSAKDASKGFSKVLGKTGAAVGKTTGRGFKQAFDSSASGSGAAAAKRIQSEIASTSKALSAARLKEQDSAGKVRVAEAALTEARKKGVAGSARVVAAEERLATATRGLDVAQDNTRKSSTQLQDAQRRLAETTVQSNQKAAQSTRLLLSSSLRRGANIGASAGLNIGKGFLSSFRRAIAPIAGVLAGYIGFAALSSGFRKFTGFIRDSVTAIGEWQVLNAQSRASVLATGGAARISARRINLLSLAIEEQTATQAEQIQEGANLLLNFKNIRNAAGKTNKVFDRTVRASVDMARALGKDVPAAAGLLGKALNDPVKGLTRLTRTGVTFTDQQKDQIKALVASGKTLQAQKIILDEVNATFGKSGDAFGKTLPGKVAIYKDALGDVGETIATGLTPSLGKFLDFATDGLNKLNESKFLKDFVLKLSEGLTKVTNKAIRVGQLLEGLSTSAKGITFQGLTDGLERIFPKLAPVLQSMERLAPAFDKLGDALTPELTDSLEKLAPPLTDLIIAILPLMGPLTRLALSIIPALTDAVETLSPALEEGVGFFAGYLESMRLMQEHQNGETSNEEYLQKIQKVKGGFGDMTRSVITFVQTAKTGLIAAGINIENWKQRTGLAIAGVVTGFLRIPQRIGETFNNAKSILFASGKEIIQRFAAGISAGISSVTSAVDDVMKRVRDFFPNSPAKTGPFSQTGWRRLKASGGAVVAQFGAGFDARSVDVSAGLERTLRTAVRAPRLVSTRSSSTGPASRRDSTRPITVNGSEIGFLRELASGEAEIVFRRESKKQGADREMGFRRDS